MAHAALAHYFRNVSAGAVEELNTTKFIEAIASRGVASRNTAHAYLKELLKYGHARSGPAGPDRRIRSLEAAPITVAMTTTWLATHLTTLDGLDGGNRCAIFLAWPQGLAAIQPLIADGLLRSIAVRKPAPAFSLFAWLNEGNILMDWLYSGLGGIRARSTAHRLACRLIRRSCRADPSLAQPFEPQVAQSRGYGKSRLARQTGQIDHVGVGRIRRRISSPTSDQARNHRRRLSQSGRGSRRLATPLPHRAFSIGPSMISVTETIASATPIALDRARAFRRTPGSRPR